MNFSLTFNIGFNTCKVKKFYVHILCSHFINCFTKPFSTPNNGLLSNKKKKSNSFVFFGKQMLRHFTTFGLSTQKYRQNKIANNGSNDK